jgi:cation:H+ antiporter
MVIGITVIGFGTSMPELLVSTQAAWIGSSGLAIGNVAGSNIANVALILGLTSIIHPLPATKQMLRIDLPFMILSMILLILAAVTNDGTIQRWQGIIMVLLLIVFISWEVTYSRHQQKRGAAALAAASSASGSSYGAPAASAVSSSSSVSSAATSSVSSSAPSSVSASTTSSSESSAEVSSPSATEAPAAPMPLWRALLLVLISLAAMVWGADLLIDGSSAIAMTLGQQFGVPQTEMERIIGLTVVAVGTSLPELFASLMAARRGETDMAVGNIIGSVTFNILSVIGVASAITPIQNAWNPFLIDYAVMFSLAIALWVFLHTHRAIVRWEGTLLFLAYILYIIYTFYI